MLRIIRRSLKAGFLDDGIISIRQEGTPQGGAFSLLLSNLLLDDFDTALGCREHRYCRYAEDFNIYLQAKGSAERILISVSQCVEEQLKLMVNWSKSAVDRPWNRSFLGKSRTFHKKPRLKLAAANLKRHKARMKGILRRGGRRSLKKVIEELLPVMRGWINDDRFAKVKSVSEALDQWLRQNLRCILLRQWRQSWTRAKRMMQRGLKEAHDFCSAFHGRGP